MTARTVRFTVVDSAGTPRTTVVTAQSGMATVVHLETPYLVAAGQSMQFAVEVGEPSENRSLADILAEAVRHGKENPSHGGNCACLDGLVREIKRQVFSVIPDSSDEPDETRRTDARWRVTYLMNAAARYV